MKNSKNQILEHATELFAKFGLNKTTIDDIAGSLHMGKSSLYHYFKSKEDIFKAVLELELKKMKKNIEESVNTAKNPKEKLQKFVLARADFIKNHENIRNVIKDEYLSFYDFITEVRKYFAQIESATIKEILKEGVDRGVFAVKDIISTSKAIIATIKGIDYGSVLNGNASHKNIKKLLAVLLDGITKNKK